MSSLSELEYSALAAQTGVSGITLDAQRVIFYDSQTGKSGSSPLQAETAFLIQETGLNTTHSETLWRTYLINQGVTYQANLNDMKRDFWLNVGYSTQTLSEYITSLTGLIAYYPLDETSGNAINQAPDTLGTLDGTVTGATQGVAGQSGNAYSFDGTNDVIDCTAGTDLNPRDGITLMALIKPSANNRRIISRDDSFTSQRSYILKIDSSNRLEFDLWVASSIKQARGGTVDVTGNVWQWFFGTYDGANVKSFINTTQTAANVAATGQIDLHATQKTFIGKMFNSDLGDTEFLAGLGQHVGVLDRALTTQEMSTIITKSGL